jgi:hypothetical protein
VPRVALVPTRSRASERELHRAQGSMRASLKAPEEAVDSTWLGSLLPPKELPNWFALSSRIKMNGVPETHAVLLVPRLFAPRGCRRGQSLASFRTDGRFPRVFKLNAGSVLCEGEKLDGFPMLAKS